MNLEQLHVGLRFDAAKPTVPVGVLGLNRRDVYFTYDDSFLARGLHLSPFRLPLKPGLQAFPPMRGLDFFGVFEDAMPDGWGRRLMDRHFQQKLNRFPLPLERLAYLGDHAMGALVFHPAQGETKNAQEVLDLAALAQNARKVFDDSEAQVLPELLAAGGSAGGARPKALIGLPAPKSKVKGVRHGEGDLPAGWEHWLVKFDSKADGKDAGALEYAYAQVAQLAGADMPKHRLIETKAGDFFAVRRFDRPTHNTRVHLHTVAGLLQVDFRVSFLEYAEIFKLTAALTRDHSQALELFRRAALNVLACNRDDHLKNFSFLMDAQGQWRLTPFYDFTFNEGPGGWHTSSVAGNGENPGLEDLRRLGQQAQLRPKEVEVILEQVRGAVAQLPGIAAETGVAKKTVKSVGERLRRIA